ncbi:MAG: alanine racemase [Gemmatimonadetes bacterium]|nr:alanine racemase [Gemmatimonadota bacterium]
MPARRETIVHTPRLLLDVARLDANFARLGARLASLGVTLRQHVKTAKSFDVARRASPAGTGPITVSTLAEAEYSAGHGVTDILYAVGIEPGKLDHVIDVRRRGVDLAVITDSVEGARTVAERGAGIPVLIEIDSDGHRAGVKPGSPLLIVIARALAPGAVLRGVMTHAGESYNCTSTAAITAMAEQERRAVVDSAAVLRAAGFECPVVSVGSTPTALFAARLDGVTEVRAGVFAFMDLTMAGLGVCATSDIAISVLVSVIGHQREKGWILTDGGWMAMSRDRGRAPGAPDVGYGVVCDEAGTPIGDLVVHAANQEHGMVASRGGAAIDWAQFPLGRRLRVLPNHACATAAQHAEYVLVNAGALDGQRWPRINGW